MVELTGVAVHALLGALIVDEAVRQGAAGQYGHGTVVFLDGAQDGFAHFATVFKGVNGTKRRDRDHFEVAVFVHVAHRNQSAVFQVQAGDVVRLSTNARGAGFFRDHVAQFRVAVVFIAHVTDEVRQLVAGNPVYNGQFYVPDPGSRLRVRCDAVSR